MTVLTTPFGMLLSLQLAASPAPPELAAEAPVPPWVPEGGVAAHGSSDDARAQNHKIRNAARATIAGGSLAIFGVVTALTGLVLYTVPKKQLGKLQSDHDGNLPPNDPKRQQAITMMRVAPWVAFSGIGIFVVGTVTAAIAGRRFKKLREDRRTTFAFSPMPVWRGTGLSAEVRF